MVSLTIKSLGDAANGSDSSVFLSLLFFFIVDGGTTSVIGETNVAVLCSRLGVELITKGDWST